MTAPSLPRARSAGLRDPALWLALAASGGLVALLARYWPTGFDYQIFYTVSRAWLAGQTRLYDAASPLFYSPPWSLALFVPLSLLPFPIGQALFVVASLTGIIWAASAIQEGVRPKIGLVLLAVANLQILNLHLVANVDGFALAGVAAGWVSIRRRQPWLLAAALWLMSLKPVNVWPAALLLLTALRPWPPRDWLKAASVLAASVAVSLALDPSWPVRYFNLVRADSLADYTLVSTVWRASAALAIPLFAVVGAAAVAAPACVAVAWRFGLRQATVSLVLATTLAFTPYATGIHYVLLVPAFVYVGRRWPMLVVAYLATWTPLLRPV